MLIVYSNYYCSYTYCTCNTGVDDQYTVTIVSTPAGTPVSGSTNTFYYPILSSVTLTCMVTSNDGSTFTMTGYSWDTTGCYYDDFGNVRCFPNGQTMQSVSEDALSARDAGTVRCTALINRISFTSGPFTLRISGTYMSIVKFKINHVNPYQGFQSPCLDQLTPLQVLI